MKEQEIAKMELLLKLNDNIIVQRFFNVKGFNPKSGNSYELYELIKSFTEELHYYLKMKTVVYMMDNQQSIMENPDLMNTSFTDDPEHFNIYVKYGDMTICHRSLDAKMYPPKVRYTVDVRPFLKELIRNLTDIFSSKELTFNYLGYQLVD